MDHPDQVEVRLGLPEGQRHRAAELYYQAFRQKLEPLMDSAEHGQAILEQGFDVRFAIVASHQGELVGVAGIQYRGHHFVNFRPAAFIDEFGWLGGLLRFALVQLATRRQRKGQLLMDGIVVASSMRGRGVGTRLLQAVFDFARENGFSSVRLDVVNTNPGARRLYERLGFAPVKTRAYPFVGNVLGFSKITSMIKQVD